MMLKPSKPLRDRVVLGISAGWVRLDSMSRAPLSAGEPLSGHGARLDFDLRLKPVAERAALDYDHSRPRAVRPRKNPGWIIGGG